ncbi:tbpl2, partial [Symbiodinium pilosum]
CYLDRICPTLQEVERRFKAHLPPSSPAELDSALVLPMFARKVPDTYHILPADGRGRPIMIFFSEAPSGFKGFLDVDSSLEGDGDFSQESWEELDKVLTDHFHISCDFRSAAFDVRKKVQHFQDWPLAEVELLLHAAVGGKKLLAWEDCLRPAKHVISLMSERDDKQFRGTLGQKKTDSWTHPHRGSRGRHKATESEPRYTQDKDRDANCNHWVLQLNLSQQLYGYQGDDTGRADSHRSPVEIPEETDVSATLDAVDSTEQTACPDGVKYFQLKKLLTVFNNEGCLHPGSKPGFVLSRMTIVMLSDYAVARLAFQEAASMDGQDEQMVKASPPVNLLLLGEDNLAPGNLDRFEGRKLMIMSECYAEAMQVHGTFELPPEVSVVLAHSRCHFKLGCELDLKEVSCKLRNAEYNPRKGTGSLHLRLFRPSATARIWYHGSVSCSVKGDLDDTRRAARRITRMIQRCGYDARCEKFRLTCQHVNADLCFPVRLEALAKKWHRHVLYEPEVHARACFYLQHPRCCVSITSSGKANVFDAPNLEDGQEAIRRVYSIFREFSC